MDIQTALASPIFIRYVWLVAGVLVFAGLVLSLLTVGFKKKLSGVWRTYRGWLVMAPLVLGTVLLGRGAIIVGVTLLALVGFLEFARATKLVDDRLMTAVVMVAITAVGIISFLDEPRRDGQGWYGLFAVFPLYAVALFLLVPIIRNRVRGQLQTLALAILGFIYFGWMFGHLGFLANASFTYGYILFLIFAVEINDVSAFTCGKLFGRHPLRNVISPNKTIEGSLGALLIAMTIPWLLRFSFPHFGLQDYIAIGLIVGIGGQVGDLVISVIKRDLGVKDMGSTIPGHGGILDRIDSLIFVAPLFFHYIRWFHGIR